MLIDTILGPLESAAEAAAAARRRPSRSSRPSGSRGLPRSARAGDAGFHENCIL
jgi:hypothetical protein